MQISLIWHCIHLLYIAILMIWLHFENGTMPLRRQLMWRQWCRCTYKNDDVHDDVGNYNDELEDDKVILLSLLIFQ